MFQTAMTGAGFMPMGEDAIDEYGMDGAFRRIVFQVFREAPGAAAACRPMHLRGFAPTVLQHCRCRHAC
jgi:hypothetical protein